jgi:transcriptional regulator with XRE-family HTH domain
VSKTVCEALRLRIDDLLKERHMTLYRLTLNAGLSHGTMMKIYGAKNNSANLVTIIQIAGGFDMTASELLNDPLFNEDNIKTK